MTIPIIFCIDAEPDERLVPKEGPKWPGFEASHKLLEAYRPKLEAATGAPVHYAWYYRLDPQIKECYGAPDWPFTHYPEQLRDFVNAGDEIGIHVHMWRWDNERNNWIADHGNQSWIETCIDMSIDTYETTIGRKPQSIRFGDRFFNEAASTYCERAGLRYDLTPEPGVKHSDAIITDGSEHYTGTLGDFTRAPRYIYKRSAQSWQIPDMERDDAMWIVPLSTEIPESAKGRIRRRALSIVGRKQPEPHRMTLKPHNHWQTVTIMMDRIIRTENTPYLAFILRSSDPAVPHRRTNIEATLNHIIKHPRAKEFQFARPGEALQLLNLI